MQLHCVPGSLDAEVVDGERGPADRVHGPVVAAAGRHATALDEELVVRQRVTDVVVPACPVVRGGGGPGVVDAVRLDVTTDVGQRQALLRRRLDRSDD